MFKKYVFAVLLITSLALSACLGGATKATETPAAKATEAPAVTVTEAPAAKATEAPAAKATEAPAAKATEAPAAKATEAPSRYTESPMLAELVKSGKLPPIEKRLPDEPFVVGPGVYMTKEQIPDWQPGQYGGTLHAAHYGTFGPDMFVAMNEPLLQAPKIGTQGVVGNVVRDFKVENGNKDFTFFMRKGLRWSDGEPVTIEDVRFVWEDILSNEKLTPVFPAIFRNGYKSDGEPGKLTIIDDWTFKISFTQPYGGFIRNLTIEGWVGYTEMIQPSHFLKKYHIKYTSLDQMADELKALNLKDEWWEVFNSKKCLNWDTTALRCINYPGLYPWIGVDFGTPDVMAFERNPYYFKVDTKGQQLPYIDKLQSTQVGNIEMVSMKVLTGEVDFLRESSVMYKIPLYLANQDKGGYRIVLMNIHGEPLAIMYNETFNDPQWQKVASDLRFRQATSLAINRKEVIDTLFYGVTTLPLDTVGEEFSQYDPDKANKLLDDMGLTTKDADGYRLYPDGKVINILLEHSARKPEYSPFADLFTTYMQKVGIKVTAKAIDLNTHSQKLAANQLQAYIEGGRDFGWDVDVTLGSVARAGQLWADWVNTLGKGGVEPPDWIKQAVDLAAKQESVVSGSDEYNQVVQDGLKWLRDNLPFITIIENNRQPLIVSKKLGNVPVSGFTIAADFSIVQMYFK